jgi:hypothetical protein
VKQTRYRALVVYAVYAAMRFDCILKSMPKANPKSIQELEAQKKAIKEAAAAEIEAIRKATAAKVAALKSSERRLRALDIREQKRRDNHAKILVGVAMIHPDFRGVGWEVQGSARRVLFRLTRPAQGGALRAFACGQEALQRPGTGLR